MKAFRLSVGVLVIVFISDVLSADPKPTPAPKKVTAPKKTTPKPTQAPKAPKEGKDFYVTIKILNQGDFDPALMQVASSQFQAMREKIYDGILQLYADYDFYQDVIPLTFENADGGILAHLAVRFTKNSEGHLDRLTQAIQSGKLGELELAPQYIDVSELDQNMLVPGAAVPVAGAPAAAPGGGGNGGCSVQCAPNFDSSCCGGAAEPVFTDVQAPDQTIYVPMPAAPPPVPPPTAACAVGCPSTCAPACTPSCCFVQKRWLAKKIKAGKRKL